jgi:esterase/lipase
VSIGAAVGVLYKFVAWLRNGAARTAKREAEIDKRMRQLERPGTAAYARQQSNAEVDTAVKHAVRDAMVEKDLQIVKESIGRLQQLVEEVSEETSDMLDSTTRLVASNNEEIANARSHAEGCTESVRKELLDLIIRLEDRSERQLVATQGALTTEIGRLNDTLARVFTRLDKINESVIRIRARCDRHKADSSSTESRD